MKKLGFILTLLMITITAVYILLNPSKNEFVEGDLLDEIVQRGYIKVGVNTNSKPFCFYNEKGDLVGYDVDLAKYIASAIVKNPEKIKFIPVTTGNRLLKASTGEVDIVISTVTITEQRKEVVSFSVPYDYAGQAVLVNKTSNIKAITDLSGQNVGVIFGTTAEKNMKNLVPNANVVGFKTYTDAYNALKLNKINAITSDDTILKRFSLDDSSVKILPKRYSREPYGIAFKKGKSTIKLKQNLDLAIKDLQSKNVIARLNKRWNTK